MGKRTTTQTLTAEDVLGKGYQLYLRADQVEGVEKTPAAQKALGKVVGLLAKAHAIVDGITRGKLAKGGQR